ncbi:MAG: hypothetical protein MIO93_00455, partial [ANME-2 cluster archaeon]|nr:hypothetical protein [ANME-2 cluster archaeon]
PDVLSESDYLPVYAGFQSQIAFCSKNCLKKQAAATLKNSKHKQARWVTQIFPGHPQGVFTPIRHH